MRRYDKYVILHYIVENVTIESIEHIKNNMDIDEYQIVVVDNASPNQSYSILEKRYKNDERVALIHNEYNLGFTRGNNVGIKYAIENYSVEKKSGVNTLWVERELYV